MSPASSGGKWFWNHRQLSTVPRCSRNGIHYADIMTPGTSASAFTYKGVSRWNLRYSRHQPVEGVIASVFTGCFSMLKSEPPPLPGTIRWGQVRTGCGAAGIVKLSADLTADDQPEVSHSLETFGGGRAICPPLLFVGDLNEAGLAAGGDRCHPPQRSPDYRGRETVAGSWRGSWRLAGMAWALAGDVHVRMAWRPPLRVCNANWSPVADEARRCAGGRPSSVER